MDQPLEKDGKPPVAAGGSVYLATAADLLASLARWTLKASVLPAWPLQVLPRNALTDSARRAMSASAVFPRAIGRAVEGFADEIAGLSAEIEPQAAETTPPLVRVHRRNKTDTAVLFIHGFGMNSENTWREFPRFLAMDPRLEAWDVYSVGYSTSLWIDIAGVWAASPPISRLSIYLKTLLDGVPFDRYKSLAIVAHSMGGLVVQQALTESTDLLARIGHVILFGTPSNGLMKAAYLRWWKRQARDMGAGSPFITELRRAWSEKFGAGLPFKFVVTAGDEDELVPSASSLEPFPKAFHAVIAGNHATIVQPRHATDLNVQLVIRQLMGEAAPAGPWNSARLAVEGREFQKAIDALWPLRAELDDATLVQLALALDSVGRKDDAMRVLEESRQQTTDAMGTLAGRLKRRWRHEGRLEDAQRSRELYGKALQSAEVNRDESQAFYHAINVAFMELAFEKKLELARQSAERALGHCQKAYRDLWCLATEGEAYLYLGDDDKALTAYGQALELNPQPWQISSMFHQAIAVADLLGNQAADERLTALFRKDAKA